MCPIVFSNVLAAIAIERLPLTQLSRVIFYCVHNASAEQAATAVVAELKCVVSLCTCHFHTVKELVSHLNGHFVEGRSVTSPVNGCKARLYEKVII